MKCKGKSKDGRYAQWLYVDVDVFMSIAQPPKRWKMKRWMTEHLGDSWLVSEL